jgi:hypothetical protein
MRYIAAVFDQVNDGNPLNTWLTLSEFELDDCYSATVPSKAVRLMVG